MAKNLQKDGSSFDLSGNTIVQVSLFCFLIASISVFVFMNALPFLEDFFCQFLNGSVKYIGEESYYLDKYSPRVETAYYTNWAVDIYKDTPSEARYWFNPFVSIFLQSIVLSLFITVFISAILPIKLGLIRKKIRREIDASIDKICQSRFGLITETDKNEIKKELDEANSDKLHSISKEWEMPFEELRILKAAMKWRNSSIFYRIYHVNDGFKLYMRNHFTIKYNNAVMGLVYVGAAVLIIIIGLRGIKFIPPSQPSYVLFALGLEFSLLVIYAFTLIYSRNEDDNSNKFEKSTKQSESLLVMNDFGDSKEVEKLLRVFIKRKN